MVLGDKMWRLKRLLSRAFPCLLRPSLKFVTTKCTSPNGPQATSSSLLVPVPSSNRFGTGSGTNRGPRPDGWKDAFQWKSADVSSSTLWDAVSWGTLAVLALQLARQLHFQASLPAEPRRVERCPWRSPLDCFLSSPLWSPRFSLQSHILPGPDGPAPQHSALRIAGQSGEELPIHSQSPSSHSSLHSVGCQEPSEEAFFLGGSSDTNFLQASSGDSECQAEPAQPRPSGEKQEQDRPGTLSLEEAVTSIQQLFQLSASIVFNFLGTESMKRGDTAAAFSYFQKAAEQGYSKAQYNVGLCHEHGRGTPQDIHKAALFYQLAASQGHRLAQYRYARCLLREPWSARGPEQRRAVSLLQQAADSGLTEDAQSRYHLGICYEKGFGVQRSLEEAIFAYQQAVALGHQPSRDRLRTLFAMETAALRASDLADTGVKSFSSPSLCSLDSLLAGASSLPHAASTGNLGHLCRRRPLGTSPCGPSQLLPTHLCSLERSLVRLGFG
ncbi:death ligand signal enhancer isoform X2 [Suncus etruscus]|uniref:death ligand signal enhancer isoform X2 n=1 Tax=Suncus etruscus TaxID=109475 RepID=UPI002110427C|nr:death ligand signal enhancer isoform X2 [Suncus etruscus]